MAGQPTFNPNLHARFEQIERRVRELERLRARRPPNLRDLQDINGYGALNGYQFFYDKTVGRYKPAIPPPMVTFNRNGTLSVGSFDKFPIPAVCKVFQAEALLTTAGSTTTTVLLKKNADTIATFTFAASSTTPTTTPEVDTEFERGDSLWADITAAGTDAAGLVLPVWTMAGAAPS